MHVSVRTACDANGHEPDVLAKQSYQMIFGKTHYA